MSRSQKGFTLMELMVVIVIVAILAAVAVPLYINYVKDAHRTEAKGAIGAVITAEQTYFQTKGEYVAVAVNEFVRNPGPGDQVLNCDLSDALTNWDFKVDVSGTPADAFVVTATGKGAPRPTTGLVVTYTYSRSGPPPADPWGDESTAP